MVSPEVATAGKILQSATARASPVASSSLVSVPSSKKRAISASSASATISTSVSRAAVASASSAAGIGPALTAPLPSGQVGQRLHRQQVDDALEAPFGADRQGDRDDGTAERLSQRFEGPLEAGALAVEAIDGHEARQAGVGRCLPHGLGLDLDAGHAVDDDHHRLDDAQRVAGVAEEVAHARAYR